VQEHIPGRGVMNGVIELFTFHLLEAAGRVVKSFSGLVSSAEFKASWLLS